MTDATRTKWECSCGTVVGSLDTVCPTCSKTVNVGNRLIYLCEKCETETVDGKCPECGYAAKCDAPATEIEQCPYCGGALDEEGCATPDCVGGKSEAEKTADSQSPLPGEMILRHLYEAGAISGMSERVIIDISVLGTIKIYEQRFCDKHFMDVLMGGPVIKAIIAAETVLVAEREKSTAKVAEERAERKRLADEDASTD